MPTDGLALWRGRAYEEFAYESFAQPEVARLDELRRHAIEARIEAALELGGGAELIAELQALVAERPLEERPRSMLMRALYRVGRQPEALATFREGTRLLGEELGLEPGPELRELERAILRHDPWLAAPPPSLRSLVVASDTRGWDVVVPLVDALAARPRRREILLARIVPPTRSHTMRGRSSPNSSDG